MDEMAENEEKKEKKEKKSKRGRKRGSKGDSKEVRENLASSMRVVSSLFRIILLLMSILSRNHQRKMSHQHRPLLSMLLPLLHLLSLLSSLPLPQSFLLMDSKLSLTKRFSRHSRGTVDGPIDYWLFIIAVSVSILCASWWADGDFHCSWLQRWSLIFVFLKNNIQL